MLSAINLETKVTLKSGLCTSLHFSTINCFVFRSLLHAWSRLLWSVSNQGQNATVSRHQVSGLEWRIWGGRRWRYDVANSLLRQSSRSFRRCVVRWRRLDSERQSWGKKVFVRWIFLNGINKDHLVAVSNILLFETAFIR